MDLQTQSCQTPELNLQTIAHEILSHEHHTVEPQTRAPKHHTFRIVMAHLSNSGRELITLRRTIAYKTLPTLQRRFKFPHSPGSNGPHPPPIKNKNSTHYPTVKLRPMNGTLFTNRPINGTIPNAVYSKLYDEQQLEKMLAPL